MIIGTGIDLVEVSRMEERLNNEAFMQKVFSSRERAYCEVKARKAEHYAARFAAKEAFLKAMGRGFTVEHDLRNIEVATEASGKPYIILHGILAQMEIAAGWGKIHVSLSHVASAACAVVIIES